MTPWSIGERAVAAWPPAWHGQNLRDMLTTLGFDIDRSWRDLPKKERDWILFTEEQPSVPVSIGYDRDQAQRAFKRKETPSYLGNFSSARRFVLNTFATTESASIKKRVARSLISSECPLCHGKRLRRQSLSVSFAGLDIADISRLPLKKLAQLLRPYAEGKAHGWKKLAAEHPEKALVAQRIAEELIARLAALLDLGLGYLSLERTSPGMTASGHIVEGMEGIGRLVMVDQKPIGRTPRSNQATYTGLFNYVRKLFAATRGAKARHYGAGRFSFNVAQSRYETCEGEGFVMVELLFLPSVYAPCPACHGTRYNPKTKTLEIKYRDKNSAAVLRMTVDTAWEFFADEAPLHRSLGIVREVGLGYLRLGQPATELSGGKAQRIKLATELQRTQRGDSLYILDEPTTGLHPSDVEKLLLQLDGLVKAGNSVIVEEHDMQVVAGSDWVVAIGPGAGEEGGRVVAAGTPAEVARSGQSRTAPYL